MNKKAMKRKKTMINETKHSELKTILIRNKLSIAYL